MVYPPLLEILFTRYSWKWLRHDVLAGLTVSIVAFPMALGLSIAMGVSPEQALWTAIIAGVLGSFFGGSRFQVSGPTGVFVLIICQTIQEYSYAGLALATCLAGVILILFGLLGLGRVIHYIPYPVVRGFLSGVSIFIFIRQIKDLLGLSIAKIPTEILQTVFVYGGSLQTCSSVTIFLSLFTFLIVICIQKYKPKYPSFLIGIIISSFVSHFLKLPIATIGNAFPSLSLTLPSIGLSYYSWEEIIQILPTAFALAFLGGIESLLSASIADSMTGTRHNTNQELIAQGIANLGVGFLGGIPTTSAFGRTIINIRAGARTQLAGIFQALFLLFFLIFLTNLTQKIPLCTLAALMIVSASRMIAWSHLKQLFKGPYSDLLIFLVTFALTLLTDLAMAVRVGISLSLLFFVMRFIKQSEKNLRKTLLQEESLNLEVPENVKILHLDGPFFFGITSTVEDLLLSMDDKIKILDMRTVPFIDATGLHVIQNILDKHPYTRFVSKHRSVTRMLQQIGIQPIFTTLEEAIESIPRPKKIS